MVKQNQTICWLLPTNCLGVFGHFVWLMLKGFILLYCQLIDTLRQWNRKKNLDRCYWELRLVLHTEASQDSQIINKLAQTAANLFFFYRHSYTDFFIIMAQQTFSCSNSTTETLTDVIPFWCLYCYLWTYFTPFSSIFIVNLGCLLREY